MTGFQSKRLMPISRERHAMELGEGTVYGERYLTVYPALRHWHEMISWTANTFGPTVDDGVWTPGQRWYVNNARFWFRDEQDRILFLLRWS